jgi:preprotein translocase subunit SecA
MADLIALRLPADIAPGRPYVELDEREPSWVDRAALALWHDALRPLLQPLGLPGWRGRRFVAAVKAQAAAVAALSDDDLRKEARALRAALRDTDFAAAPVARCFALVQEAAWRTSQRRHHDNQLMAGWWLLKGTLVEMATGEGKTFAATLPAITAALAGLPVHVITVNDYLAARDAEAMGPLYAFFGLRARAVVHGMAPAERRAAYACEVAYASNKELAFDYLRDRSALGDRASVPHRAVARLHAVTQAPGPARAEAAAASPDIVLRGLCFALVDEADSVFIDEARTPLILSRTLPAQAEGASCAQALAIAGGLLPHTHYELDRALRRVRLKDAGCDQAAVLDAAQAESPFTSARRREEAVQQALSALHLYTRDQHYVVVDGKVQIVDESTGRAMPDRAWERGLHQMIEAKEGLALTGARETLARLTFQRLFRRYLRLAGMSGTGVEVAGEIGRTYRLPVVGVPLHRPSQRRLLPTRCCANAQAKWRAVAERIAEVAMAEGRPVLVGTRTVQASEALSAVLAQAGIAHTVLNARQDAAEAQVVAAAGERGRVTVATNMAGRGTDIVLAPGVAERGGLHVILTEYHESRRIDRQLIGRCARQGDPGSAQAIVALDDELFAVQVPRGVALLGARALGQGLLARAAVAVLRTLAQRRAERRNRLLREASLSQDRRIARTLAFSGRGE